MISLPESLVLLARKGLERGRYPDSRTELVERVLGEVRCSPNYPDPVAHNIAVARELCVAGCIYWELFTVAMHYAAVACESALKERFLAALTLPFRVLPPAAKKGEKQLEPKVFQVRPLAFELFNLLAAKWRIHGELRKFSGMFGSLIVWAEASTVISGKERDFLEKRKRFRNHTAHGHNMVGLDSWALSDLDDVTMFLNRLFPDPATTAYDATRSEARRAKWEARRKEFDDLLAATATQDEREPEDED